MTTERRATGKMSLYSLWRKHHVGDGDLAGQRDDQFHLRPQLQVQVEQTSRLITTQV